MMKMIMPIARPASVSVSQVEPLPTSGRASSASARDQRQRHAVEALARHLGDGRGGRVHGRKWMKRFMRSASIDGPRARGRAGAAAAPRPRPARPCGLRARTRPSSITDDAVAQCAGHREVLLDEQDGRLRRA